MEILNNNERELALQIVQNAANLDHEGYFIPWELYETDIHDKAKVIEAARDILEHRVTYYVESTPEYAQYKKVLMMRCMQHGFFK